jgi:hypothetical protein
MHELLLELPKQDQLQWNDSLIPFLLIEVLMSKCPYTFVKSMFGKPHPTKEASHLRVTVTRGEETTVDAALPAHSARWLMELIPEDVLTQIYKEGIPIEKIQEDLSQQKVLFPRKIFTLTEPHRAIDIWLE